MKMKSFLSAVMVLVFLTTAFCFNVNAVVSKKVKLVMWQSVKAEEQMEATKGLANKYMELHPNVEIEVIFIGGGLTDYHTKINLALLTRKGPDIATAGDAPAYQFVEPGFLSPVPDYVADYCEKFGISKDVMNSAKTREGRFYGVVTIWHGLVVFYNKDMLTEAGLSVPPDDWDWDMLMNYARKQTKYDSQGKVTRAGLSLRKTGHPKGIIDKWAPFFFAAGVPTELSYWTEDLTKTIINSSPAREALQFYLDALYKYKVDSLEVKSDYKGFTERTVAMFHRGYWIVSYCKDYAPDINLGIVHVPKKEFAQFASGIISGSVNIVTRDSKHTDEAWKYLYWLIQPEQNAYQARKFSSLPGYKNAAQMEIFQTDPKYRTALSQRARPEAKITNIYELGGIIGGYIEKVCYHVLSIDEALKRAEEECNKILTQTEK